MAGKDQAPPGENRDKAGRFKPGVSGNPSGLSRQHHDSVESPDDLEPNWTNAQLASLRGIRGDGWASALTGIGTEERDKRLSHSFYGTSLSYQETLDLWEKDDMASAAIEMPAKECFREGYEITISDEGEYEDLKETIEEKLIELDADDAIERAMNLERAFGGAAILIGADDHQPLDKPLDMERVTSLDWLNVLEPLMIHPVAFYDDPLEAKFGEPEFYQINTYGQTSLAAATIPGRNPTGPVFVNKVIHESRLIKFNGIRISQVTRSQSPVAPYWGTSVLPRFVEILRDFNIAYHAAGILGVDVGQPVISIENLMTNVVKHPDRVQARMAALNLGKSTARAIILDTKEKFERQTTNLSGIPELLDRLSRRLSAAVGIPLSILLGFTPDGMGKSSETELEQWHNIVRSMQRRRLTPILRMLAKMIMQSVRKRKIPKKWGIRWHELKRLTDGQRAEARLTQARADELYAKYGILTADEIRKARFGGEYSYETPINEKEEAPGYVAALPAGVMAVEGTQTVPGGAKVAAVSGGADKVPVAAPGAHSVGGYTRRDPNVGTKAPRGDEDGPGKAITFAGFDIVIESPKGSYRYWTDTDGTEGKTKMRIDYGYIVSSLGNDGDSLDVYKGPNEAAEWVYIVHQNKKPDFTEFDEDKILIGFDSANHARDAYIAQYDDERFFGGMTQMKLEEFRDKVNKHVVGRLTHANIDASGEPISPVDEPTS